MDSINFTGKHIGAAKIKHLVEGKYKPKEVSFVELNPDLVSDVYAAEDAHFNWGSRFGKNISEDIFQTSIGNRKGRFFALTTQSENFDNIDSSQILGLAEMSTNSKANTIEYLQVNPRYIKKRKPTLMDRVIKVVTNKEKEAKPTEFKDIGTAILDAIKKITDRPIDLFSVKDATQFYEKNGFKVVEGKHPRHYIWGDK